MRLLADENIPLTTVRALRSAGHDVYSATEEALAPPMSFTLYGQFEKTDLLSRLIAISATAPSEASRSRRPASCCYESSRPVLTMLLTYSSNCLHAETGLGPAFSAWWTTHTCAKGLCTIERRLTGMSVSCGRLLKEAPGIFAVTLRLRRTHINRFL
jgi:hypothetical protein